MASFRVNLRCMFRGMVGIKVAGTANAGSYNVRSVPANRNVGGSTRNCAFALTHWRHLRV